MFFPYQRPVLDYPIPIHATVMTYIMQQFCLQDLQGCWFEYAMHSTGFSQHNYANWLSDSLLGLLHEAYWWLHWLQDTQKCVVTYNFPLSIVPVLCSDYVQALFLVSHSKEVKLYCKMFLMSSKMNNVQLLFSSIPEVM